MEDVNITAEDYVTMMPVMIIVMIFAVLISILFPNLNWFNDDDKYFKSYKPNNPTWRGKER